RHWLDGDGMVCAVSFDRGRASFSNRFIRSTKFCAEESARRPLFRAFGTTFPSARLHRGMALYSPVNIAVYQCGSTLLAFGEQGLPWELDPQTLETRGEFTFNGALNAVSPMSAHPKFDPATGQMFCFGVGFDRKAPHVNLYCFDRAFTLTYRRRLPLE